MPVVLLIILTLNIRFGPVPSESMDPTIARGDVIFLNVGRLNFDRGDIVYFQKDVDNDGSIEKVVKRVVGFPGDTVEIVDRILYVNGEKTY